MVPGRGALRLTRVALFALSAVGLASAAHLAGGESLSPLAALIAVPVVMIVMNLFAGARRGRSSLLLAMGLTQVLLHLAFMIDAAARSCQVVGGREMGTMPAFTGGASQVAVHCSSSMTSSGASAGLWPSTGMLLAHSLATLLMVLLLAHGETVVWALAACLRFETLLPGPAVRVRAVRRLPVLAATGFWPRSTVLRSAIQRRGPPASAFAAP